VSALAEVAAAVAQAKGVTAPAGCEGVKVSVQAKQIADALASGAQSAILLGAAAAQHPQASQLHAFAQWLAQNTDAKFGYLVDGANAVGGYLANAVPGKGANAQQAFAQPRKAYVLLHAEPKFDCANPQAAWNALEQAEMVVVMSPFKQGLDYADVLLPVAPFSETSGTFVNMQGLAQSFNGSVKPLGETRPAWKVLRVLGNLLDLQGFGYESSEEVRNEVLGAGNVTPVDVSGRLSNLAGVQPQAPSAASAALERIADVPLYFSDAIVRRASSLQQTSGAQAPVASISSALAARLGVADGADVLVKQGDGSAIVAAAVDAKLPENVVRLSAGHISTSTLGAMFGAITVEKA
jgi:NADH-quinone oxidoreductase subunit G